MLQDPNIPGLGELDQAMGAGMKQPLSMAAGGGVQLNTAGNRTAGASYGPARAGLTMNNMLNKDFLCKPTWTERDGLQQYHGRLLPYPTDGCE